MAEQRKTRELTPEELAEDEAGVTPPREASAGVERSREQTAEDLAALEGAEPAPPPPVRPPPGQAGEVPERPS
ncbi:MAG: hypothetical protein M3336_07490 [Chloroflexota bacterium]|nr:hypothetical protein [Chloroflexota bacterium]